MAVRLANAGIDVSITARNAPDLVSFYEDVLGLPLAKRLDWPDHGATVWFFAIGDGHLKVLGLDHPPAAANPPGGNRAATGYRYIAIQVEDVQAVLAAIEGTAARADGPVRRHGDSTVVFVSDPEGNTIEFVQRH